jgi:type II secretory pathway pseudopilin PulG
MKYKPTFAYGSAGDTIVEVLIVMAVVTVVLTGAFTVASRSVQAIRDSEERAQAVQYLQGQVELLRSAASRSGGLNFDLATPFCLDTTTHYLASDMAHCQLGSQSQYNMAIVLNSGSDSGTTTSTFDLTATWTGLTSATDKVYLSYRVAIAP